MTAKMFFIRQTNLAKGERHHPCYLHNLWNESECFLLLMHWSRTGSNVLYGFNFCWSVAEIFLFCARNGDDAVPISNMLFSVNLFPPISTPDSCFNKSDSGSWQFSFFPVPGGDPQSHAQPQHQLQQQRAGGGRQDGDGRGQQDGGHRALLRGVAGRHEEAVGRLRRPGMLFPVQRIPAERLCKIVSISIIPS